MQAGIDSIDVTIWTSVTCLWNKHFEDCVIFLSLIVPGVRTRIHHREPESEHQSAVSQSLFLSRKSVCLDQQKEKLCSRGSLICRDQSLSVVGKVLWWWTVTVRFICCTTGLSWQFRVSSEDRASQSACRVENSPAAMFWNTGMYIVQTWPSFVRFLFFWTPLYIL